MNEGVDATTLLGNTVLISVAGGLKDLMVHCSQCVAEGLGLEGQSVSYTTEALEGCGFGVNHAALVWCKQLTSRYLLRTYVSRRFLCVPAKLKVRGRQDKV